VLVVAATGATAMVSLLIRVARSISLFNPASSSFSFFISAVLAAIWLSFSPCSILSSLV